jgi:hypothetical protein
MANPFRKENTMAKTNELTPKTVETLEALKAVGGTATLAELKAAGYDVASANLTSLVKNGKIVAEDVEIEYTAVKTVKKYTVVAE